MAHMIGADPAQLDVFGGGMHSAADQLDRIRTTISALLASSHWDGRDADMFRHDWHSTLAARLTGVAGFTRQAATTVRTEAEQQRHASQADGSTGGSADSRHRGNWVQDLLDAKSPFDGVFFGLGVVGLGLDVLGRLKDQKSMAGLLQRLPSGVQEILFKDLTKESGLAKALGVGGAALGKGVAVVSAGIDLMDFANELATNPDDPATYNAGVTAYLSTATAVAAFTCPPLAVVLGGIGLAYSVSTAIDPTYTKDLITGAGHVLNTVWETGGDVVEAATDRVNDMADTAHDVIDGGFNAVKKLLW